MNEASRKDAQGPSLDHADTIVPYSSPMTSQTTFEARLTPARGPAFLSSPIDDDEGRPGAEPRHGGDGPAAPEDRPLRARPSPAGTIVLFLVFAAAIAFVGGLIATIIHLLARYV